MQMIFPNSDKLCQAEITTFLVSPLYFNHCTYNKAISKLFSTKLYRATL